jgi:hypothetical protein
MDKKRKQYNSAINIGSLLPKVLLNIEKKYRKNPRSIIEAWPKVIGEKLASMTRVVSYNEGILIVKVKSSTLYSLLNNYEKEILLKKLQKKFSKEIIHKLIFKLG